MYNQLIINSLDKALSKLSEGFSALPPTNPTLDMAAIDPILLQVAEKMQDNYPYFHPFYAGQMLKPPHEIARLAYMLAMWVNPNNHALDGGRASSAMEKGGVFSQNLAKSRQAALLLYQKIVNSAAFIPLVEPELDIVCWAVKGASVSEINLKTKKLFDLAAKHNLHLALLNYPVKKLQNHWKLVQKDAVYVTCLRSCLMKAEHLDWIESIWTLLLEAMNDE
jgi:hypothetical protein